MYEYIDVGGLYVAKSRGLWRSYRQISSGLDSLEEFVNHSDRHRQNKLRRLVKSWLNPWSKPHVISAPVDGDVLLPVHRGFRVFDFKQGTVTRVFRSDVRRTIRKAEVAIVEKASVLKCAPDLINVCERAEWYTERFAEGKIAYSAVVHNSAAIEEFYQCHVEPALREVVETFGVERASLEDTVGQRLGVIKERLSSGKLKSHHKKHVLHFIDELLEKMAKSPGTSILTGFSHGDLSLRNIVSTQTGACFIDWEEASTRSVLSDVYNFFFTEMYYQRASSTMDEEIARAARMRLNHAMSLEINTDTDNSNVLTLGQYRRVYYLERISSLCERTLDNQLLGVASKLVNVYEKYERRMAKRRAELKKK